jgi:hypothetical protein
MAPEQLSGGAVDARSDVFAFGVLACELATGERPFGADAASVLARMTELMERRRSAGLSRPLPLRGLDRIALRCMRALPEERYLSGAALLADLRALHDGHTAPPMAAADDRFWWWQFHQIAISALNGVMPAAVWAVRRWIDRPYGSAMFFVALGLATISITLRLNLWFTARVHPDTLVHHRARLYPAIVFADALLGVVLLGAAAFIVGTHDEVAALLLSMALVTLASLALIEPATTRGAGVFSGGGPPAGRR